jgi:hypothetical protein
MNLEFNIASAEPLRNAAVPLLNFHLEVKADAPVHAILLRAQIQIEPRRRRHNGAEQSRLVDLFGEPDRWSESQHPLVWSQSAVNITAFDSNIGVDLPVACTYDFEVASAKYLAALGDGEIPLRFLFSGTVFARTSSGFRVEQIPWSKEALFRLPVATWRELMDSYFPGQAWIRVRRETLEILQRLRASEGMSSWDEAIESMLAHSTR